MSKLPSIHLYPGDWYRDDVSGCSLAAQGLWLRMMFIGHDSDRYGYLEKNGVPIPPESIARRCGCTPEQYTSLLSELDAAGVTSRTPNGSIFSRRMVKDAAIREQTKARVKRHRSNAGVTLAVTQEYEDEDEIESNASVVELELSSLKENRSKERSISEQAITLIYNAYPRKVARGAAIKSIEKAIKRHAGNLRIPEEDAAESIYRAVKLFAGSPAGKRGEFTPHCASWMNADRYLDDPKEWERDDGQTGNKQLDKLKFALQAVRASFASDAGTDADAGGSEDGQDSDATGSGIVEGVVIPRTERGY